MLWYCMKCVSIVNKYLLLIGRFRITSLRQAANVDLYHLTKFPLYLSLTVHYTEILYFYLYFIFLHLALITELLIIENKIILRRGAQLDLLQVDLLASGASLFWPRSGLKSDEGLF